MRSLKEKILILCISCALTGTLSAGQNSLQERVLRSLESHPNTHNALAIVVPAAILTRLVKMTPTKREHIGSVAFFYSIVLSYYGYRIYAGTYDSNAINDQLIEKHREDILERMEFPEELEEIYLLGDGHRYVNAQSVFKRLVVEAKALSPENQNLKWELYVDVSLDANVSVAPTGKVTVTTEMLRQTNSDMLAFVLAHEMGHTMAKHAAKRTAFMNTWLASTEFLFPIHLIINEFTTAKIAARFCNRSIETEADLIGLYLVAKAGFDPNGALETIDLLEQEVKKHASQNVFSPYTSTHPIWTKRRANLEFYLPYALMIAPQI